MFYTINLANFWAFGWAAIGIFIVSTDVVHLLFGKSYILNWNIPMVIALNFYMVGIQNAVWLFNNAMGLFRQGRYLLLLTAAVNLACSIWLGQIWGLFGILIATAISRLFTNTWYDSYKLFKYGFHQSVVPYYARRGLYFLLLLITAGICYSLANLASGTLVFNIIYKIVICCVIPNTVFFCVFHKHSEFAYYMTLIKRLIAGRKNRNKQANNR